MSHPPLFLHISREASVSSPRYHITNLCDEDNIIITTDQSGFHKRDSRFQVAVLLMDTQGAFDNKSSVKENAVIFSLSVLLSSLQASSAKR